MTSAIAVLEKLKRGFIAELPEKINEIEEDILSGGCDGVYDETFQELYRKVHSLKGSGGTFGVSIITSICHQLEDSLTHWREQAHSTPGEHQKCCLSYVDLLRQVYTILNDGDNDFSAVVSVLHEIQGERLDDKLRVMLVDSSRTTREICKQAIYQYHAEVVEMIDGYEALGRLLNEHFDVLIAGKEIGPLNGLALISAVSELSGSQVKTILITSSRDIVNTQRHSDPSAIVDKGLSMVGELLKLFNVMERQHKSDV